jgi:hypothetical protein
MQFIEQFLQMICSESVGCHVIVNTHIKNVTDENDVLLKELPNALGSKLPPLVASYFNTTLLVKTVGSGMQKKRQIFTKSTSFVETKTPAPNSVKPNYPQETGLAEYFADLFGPKSS